MKLLNIERHGDSIMFVRKAFPPHTIIDEAGSIRDAIAHIEFVGNNYDAIILDPDLPDFQSIESIRTIRLSSQSPIVIHISSQTKEIEALSKPLGVYEILHKDTVSSNGIRRAVDGAIAKHQLHRIEILADGMSEARAKFRQALLKLHETT